MDKGSGGHERLPAAQCGVRRMNRGGYTYFIQGDLGGPIKIGWALNPIVRLRELQCGSPVKLSIAGIITGDCERELHRDFSRARLLGEWFANIPDLVDFIKDNAKNPAVSGEDFCKLCLAIRRPWEIREANFWETAYA